MASCRSKKCSKGEGLPDSVPTVGMEFLKERLIGSHIVDVTEQFVGNGLIITGLRKPEASH